MDSRCGDRIGYIMKFARIEYSELNARQKEIYNFQKIAGVLADYGFNCIKLADDWQGADFLAYHKDGKETLRVQLKGRLTIDRKYQGRNLHIAFPISDSWCLIEHDRLIELVGQTTNWLNTDSWCVKGGYNSQSPNKKSTQALEGHILNAT